MFRYIFQFIALLIFFAVARSVLTWILRTVVSSFRTASGSQPPPPPDQRTPDVLTSAGELHQDPVCGTFVPGTSRWTRSVDGRTLYFCSSDCRDRFLVSARG